MIFGGSESYFDCKMDKTNFWKFKKPVSNTHVLWKVLAKFVKNRSPQPGISGFL